MNKTVKILLILGFVFLAAGFISSLFFHNLSLNERLHTGIVLMTTVGFGEIGQIPRVPALICAISGGFAFLSFFAAIILSIVGCFVKKVVKETEDTKIKRALSGRLGYNPTCFTRANYYRNLI